MASQCISKHLLRVIKPKFSVKQVRYSSYIGSKVVGPLSQYTDVEISKNPEEWKFVERLLPKKIIPEPSIKEIYPSGWKPMDKSSLNLPYFVKRTRNHMPPIFLKITERGVIRITTMKNIQGDIQQLNNDLCDFLQQHLRGAKFVTQVNEMQAQIRLKGDYVALLNKWFIEKGF